MGRSYCENANDGMPNYLKYGLNLTTDERKGAAPPGVAFVVDPPPISSVERWKSATAEGQMCRNLLIAKNMDGSTPFETNQYVQTR
jgi:hypothetical protein